MSPAMPDGTVLAFDFGEKRIGVATGETLLNSAHPLTVIHAGAFYPGIRGPETLIEALKRMHAAASLDGRLVVECVGDDSVRYREQADAAGLAGVLRFVPPVPFDECQRKIAASHLTLILDTAGYGGVFLPTKLFEAFASRRPVLGLAEPGEGRERPREARPG